MENEIYSHLGYTKPLCSLGAWHIDKYAPNKRFNIPNKICKAMIK